MGSTIKVQHHTDDSGTTNASRESSNKVIGPKPFTKSKFWHSKMKNQFART
jgi:hypothetical protein